MFVEVKVLPGQDPFTAPDSGVRISYFRGLGSASPKKPEEFKMWCRI